MGEQPWSIELGSETDDGAYQVRSSSAPGERRLYVLHMGHSIGFLDESNGSLHLDDEAYREGFEAALLAYLRRTPIVTSQPSSAPSAVRRHLPPPPPTKRRRTVRNPLAFARPSIAPTGPCGAPVEPLSTRQRTKAIIALTALVVLGVASHRMGQQADPDLAGMGGAVRQGTIGAHSSWPLGLGGEQDRPTATRADSGRPLGTPLPVDADAGPHGFMMLQPGTQDPVAYDPCRPLSYVVNDRSAPPGAADLVADAVATVGHITGLRFEHAGPSDEVPPIGDRPMYQKERYGDRWPPILIAWSTPEQVPELAGDIAGLGGSTAVTTMDDGPVVYVSGVVALDAPQLGYTMAGADGAAQVRAVILHELAHVVGLGHVADPTQLMYEAGSVSDFQPGDLAGLARLGAGECIPRL